MYLLAVCPLLHSVATHRRQPRTEQERRSTCASRAVPNADRAALVQPNVVKGHGKEPRPGGCAPCATAPANCIVARVTRAGGPSQNSAHGSSQLMLDSER